MPPVVAGFAVPESVTVSGFRVGSGSSLAMLSEPEAAPATVGANCTVMSADLPAARVSGAKAGTTLKLELPLGVMDLMRRSAWPVLLIVNFIVVGGWPSVTAPKFRDCVETEIEGVAGPATGPVAAPVDPRVQRVHAFTDKIP